MTPRSHREGLRPTATSLETPGAPCTTPSSEELGVLLPVCLGAPKSSSARPSTGSRPRLRGDARRPLATGRAPRSPVSVLPAGSGAPRSVEASRRETASRLPEGPSADADATPRPEGRSTVTVKALGPSRDPSARPWTASPVRRPPRHPASMRPSPRTLPQTPSSPPRPEGRIGEGGEYVEALRTCW